MKFYVPLALCLLAGCAEDRLAAELPALQGQPAAQVVHYLGTPTETIKTVDSTTYSWINRQTGSFYVPDNSSQPVVVSGSNGHPTIAFTQPHMPPMQDTYDWHCRLDIIAKKGVIIDTHYDGNAGGCQGFSDKLKPLLASPK